MQDWPLTVDRILDHAALAHGHGEVVTRSLEGPIVRTTYARMHERAKRATGVMRALGVQLGDGLVGRLADRVLEGTHDRRSGGSGIHRPLSPRQVVARRNLCGPRRIPGD